MASRKRSSRWDIDPYGVKRPRRNFIGPALPGGQYYSRSQQAMADPRNRRVYQPSRFSGSSGELKFFDTALAFNFDATGEVPTTGQLALIPQGVTDSTRIGRKCTIKSIQIKGYAALTSGAAANSGTLVYLWVVQDTQCNGAAAAITDVATSNNMATNMLNLANSQRFRILKKFTRRLIPEAGVTTAYSNDIKEVKWYKRCNIPIEYSSTAGALTEIRSNNIFLLAGSDAVWSDDAANFVGTCRLRFAD